MNNLRILFVSNLFPDVREPNRGLVNARLVRSIAKIADIRVLAPQPSLNAWLNKSNKNKCLPADSSFDPLFPLVPYVPKFGSLLNDSLFAYRIGPCIQDIRNKFPFDVVLCSWLFPDASAIARLAPVMGFPYVAVAQGSDVHQYLHMAGRRSKIVATVNESAKTITRSAELARLLFEAHVEKNKLEVIYNGVETDVFYPGNAQIAREKLGLPVNAKIILYIGNLLPVKNPGLALESFGRLVSESQAPADLRLVFIGQGALERELRGNAESMGISAQILFVGAQPPAQVAEYLRAADVLCLPSDNEGLPNVLLEALACGKPVVATRVGGIPEVLNRPELGRLVPARDAKTMTKALTEILLTPPSMDFIASVGRNNSWKCTAEKYVSVLQAAVDDFKNSNEVTKIK
jgi:glycosyltransferase involved in cell wall biosynthesis